MGLFHFLIVVQAIIAAALVAVILMQRSEGGGLGVGGSPSGLMSARGAADFMTRSTTVLATLFIGLSIALAVVASNKGKSSTLDTSFERSAPANDALAPAAGEPAKGEAAKGDAATSKEAVQPAKDAATPAKAAVGEDAVPLAK